MIPLVSIQNLGAEKFHEWVRRELITIGGVGEQGPHWLAGPGSRQGEKLLMHSERAIGEIRNFSN